MRAPVASHVSLSRAMRGVRLHLGVAQTALARRMRCTRSWVSHFENAHELPGEQAWETWLRAVAEAARSKPRQPEWSAALEEKLSEAKRLYAEACADTVERRQQSFTAAQSTHVDGSDTHPVSTESVRIGCAELSPTVALARREEDDAMRRREEPDRQPVRSSPGVEPSTEAIELLRNVEDSDIGPGTLDAIGRATDLLCRSYSSMPPAVLRQQVRQQLAQVRGLLDGRLTLAQRRELMVLAGWLSLLLACLSFDIGQRQAAEANRVVTFHLGDHTGYAELQAWALETAAWFAVADGRYSKAVELSQRGLGFSGSGTSVSVQLSVQEARAWACQGNKTEARAALHRASESLRRLPTPDHPEHHFVFDPTKLLFYVATCSARVGDAERAEDHAREVVRQSTDAAGAPRWPRRLVTARLDLGLALTQLRRPDEACDVGALALASGSLLPSNVWRATALDVRLMRDYPTLPDARDLHERFIQARHSLDPSV